MRRRAALSLIVCVFLLCGCTSILETERVLVTPHEDMNLSAPAQEPTPNASNYDELLAVTRNLLERAENSGRVNVFEYEGDLNADVTAVRDELLFHDALGSYALSDVMLIVTPIVSFMDIQIELSDRRSAEQIDSIINVSTQRYLRMELLSMMSDYRSDAAILTSLSGITVDEVLGYLSELYYENPLEIAMLPITTVEVYPPEPTRNARLIELNFDYTQSSATLKSFSDLIKSAARDVAESASGENDAEILLSLCVALSELSDYDSALGSLSEYSSQNIAATAYGALSSGSAIGEGYAMAYKALCESLTITCQVVLGTRDNLPYAWNIVSYDGSSYHIDPALCDEAGMAEGFFKSDLEMSERYVWDRANYPMCDGLLSYVDIAAPANWEEGVDDIEIDTIEVGEEPEET
ncbi:MAG: hypothetical protein GX823_07085 [Clostridiales bacterium]|nr:hypothetical protein [Clostridiales bacterium]